MAKNESTAVNELLQRMATMTPLKPDPSDDLMFRRPPSPSPSQLAPRTPASSPARGSDVAPLPRNRAANGTPVGTMTMQGLGGRPMPPVPPAAKSDGGMTMQGLGPVVQRAIAESEAGAPAPRRAARTPLPLPAPAAPAMPAPPPVRSSQAQPVQAEPAPARSSQPHPAQVLEAPPMKQRAATPAPRSMPVAAPFESGAMSASGHAPPAAAAVGIEAPSRAWFELAHAQAQLEHVPQEERWVGTLQLNRRRRSNSRTSKLVAPLVAFTVAGALAAGYVAFFWQGGASSAPAASAAPAAATIPAPTAAAEKAAPSAPAVAAAAPAAAPVAPAVAAAPAARPAAPAFVDVMIVSSPAGATVTLVDRGRTSFIGTTPISTALDPSRKYELIFSQPGKPTWVEPLDPSATRRVDVKLGTTATAEPVAASARPRIERKVERAAAPAPAAEKAVAAPAGEGVLMLASKPPCEIFINGKATGLTTPQREIRLPAGSHKVTLLNQAEGIKKTISVQIDADKPTKVIQDLMPQ